MVGLAQIKAEIERHALTVAGGVQQGAAVLPHGVASLLLIAPEGQRFWSHFTQTPEYRDGQPDPMDRWSVRVLSAVAQSLDAQAFFPFGISPPHPFFTWAVASGQARSSPVQWLIHPDQGLWLSFRGALGFAQPIALPAPAPAPCEGCARPCVTACPVGALTDKGYDLPACHAFLDSPEGADCLNHGCAVRRACPVSQGFGRDPDQSAFHMRHFHR